jgi:small-conductance mechanosensitive channel
MANSILSHNISMFITFLVHWLRENFLHPIGFMQIGAIGVSFLIAWLFSLEIHKYSEKDIDRVKAHMRVTVSSAHFAIIFKYFFLLLLVWFCQALFKKFSMSTDILHMTLDFVIALFVIRFASFYIKSTFWSRLVYVISLMFISLRIFKLWHPTVELLDSMTIGLGKVSISIWGLIEAIVVFIVLWVAAGAANRFFAHWITSSTKLTYSDRTLIQRVIKAATATVVILISIKAAGARSAY